MSSHPEVPGASEKKKEEMDRYGECLCLGAKIGCDVMAVLTGMTGSVFKLWLLRERQWKGMVREALEIGTQPVGIFLLPQHQSVTRSHDIVDWS